MSVTMRDILAAHGMLRRYLSPTPLYRHPLLSARLGFDAYVKHENHLPTNSFKVRGEGSLPPHTSGCAFDLSRKHMPADEQNFVMEKLAEMERAGELDALIEYGVNACFHVFIYRDGIPPRAFYFGPTEYETIPLFASLVGETHEP